MGVSERYKKTEIGILPNDWLCVDAADAMDFRGGYSFKSSDAKKSGVRWLKIANVGKSKIL